MVRVALHHEEGDEKADIKVHHIFRAMFWGLFGNVDDFNFTTGIFLKRGGRQILLRMKYKSTPQDYEAHVYLFGLKGASSLAPCPLCDNCIGIPRAFFEDDSGFTHGTLATMISSRNGAVSVGRLCCK